MRDLILRRNKLCETSKKLRYCSFLTDNNEQVDKLRQKQDETYKKFIFYREFIKAMEVTK